MAVNGYRETQLDDGTKRSDQLTSMAARNGCGGVPMEKGQCVEEGDLVLRMLIHTGCRESTY